MTFWMLLPELGAGGLLISTGLLWCVARARRAKGVEQWEAEQEVARATLALHDAMTSARFALAPWATRARTGDFAWLTADRKEIRAVRRLLRRAIAECELAIHRSRGVTGGSYRTTLDLLNAAHPTYDAIRRLYSIKRQPAGTPIHVDEPMRQALLSAVAESDLRERREQRVRRMPARIALAASSIALTALHVDGARADAASPYCARVRALADSQAALLYAPRAEIQGIRFPTNGAVDTAALVGDDFQLRAAISFSPLDAYKGTRVVRVAKAECAQHEATRSVEDVLIASANAGRAPALREAVAFLDSRVDHLDQVEKRATEGVAAGLMSLLEAGEIHGRCASIRKHREFLAGEAGRIESLHALAVDAADLEHRLTTAERAALALEARASTLRKLDAWDVRLSGGAAPDGESTEIFGVAHVAFSFGALAQRAAEKRVAAARADELASSRTELRSQVATYRSVIAANLREASRSAQIAERRVEDLQTLRDALQGSSASRAPLARDLLDLDLILAHAEVVYFGAWVSQLRSAGGAADAD